MHEGEEPGAEAGTLLPEILLRNRADEGVLDEIVSPGQVVGQPTSIASQARVSLSRSRPRSFTLAAYVLGESTSRVRRLSEARRRKLDNSEAQSFQDLLLCGSLRLVGDELHAGLAGSSQISV